MASRSSEKCEQNLPQFFQEGNKLHLSGQCLTKVPKHALPSQLPKITQLLLDNNELRRFDNLQQYSSVVEFSASHNKIHNMCQVAQLKHLIRLDLSHNSILSIEGLRDLVHLKHLNLSRNKIKAMDQLLTNLQLELLDVSENAITVISNINHLSKLKKLFLHKNSISLLKHCGVNLPVSLEILTLAGNKITDLNEVSHLAGLINLKEVSIVLNPCVQMTGNQVGFDYRPFMINWCESLKIIDDFAVDEIECLKGEWLHCQGRGHQFRPGQHAELVQYLAETCPLHNQNLQTQDERKLRMILSKAHHHQSQLEMAENPIQASGKNERGSIKLDSDEEWDEFFELSNDPSPNTANKEPFSPKKRESHYHGKEIVGKIADQSKAELSEGTKNHTIGSIMIKEGKREDNIVYPRVVLQANKKGVGIAKLLSSSICEKYDVRTITFCHPNQEKKRGACCYINNDEERVYEIISRLYEMTLKWYFDGKECKIKVNIDGKNGVTLLEGNGVTMEQLRANKEV